MNTPIRNRRLPVVCALFAAVALSFGALAAYAQESKKTLKKKPIGPVDQPQSEATSGATAKPYRLKPPSLNFSPPVTSFAEPDFNWGSVLQGEVVEHDFTILNNGGSVLKIERVKPACGCTTVDYSKEIAPGQIGKVTLRVDTKKFQGTVKKTAEVSTNASRTTTRLSMSGKIDPVVTIEPKLPRIETVRGITTEPLTVTVTKASDHAFKLLSVKPDSDVVEAKLVEQQAGELYSILLTPKITDDKKKYHYAQVNLSVEVGEKTFDLPLRVSITVKDRIEATPASVYFSSRDTEKLRAAGAAPISKQVTIRSLDPSHKFEIKDVEVQGSNFIVERTVVEAGREYRLNVQLPQLPADGTRRVAEKILVRTDDAEISEIVINATASIRSRSASGSPAGRTTTRPATNRIVPKAGITTDGKVAPFPKKK